MTKRTNDKRKFKLKIKNQIINDMSYDYQRITLRFIVGHKTYGFELTSDQPTEGKFDYRNHCRLRVNDKSSGKVLRKDGFDIVVKQVRLKPQIYLRELVLNKLGRKRMSSVVWQHGQNVLPPAIRNELIAKNLSFKFFDGQLLKWMDEKISTAAKDMIADYQRQFGVFVPNEKLEVYVKRVELINDVLGTCEYKMAEDKNFVSRFDEVIHNEEVTYFDSDNRKHGLSRPTKSGVDTSTGAKRIKMIRGYCKDKSIEKIYLKSVDKEGAVNRSETIFKEDALDLILGNRKLYLYGANKLIFSDQLRKLKKVRKKRFYKIIAFSPLAKFPRKKNKLKSAIKMYCGKFADEIIRCYFRWKILATGSSSILSKGAQRKIRQLANEQKLFRMEERSEYEIDNFWIGNTF